MSIETIANEAKIDFLEQFSSEIQELFIEGPVSLDSRVV